MLHIHVATLLLQYGIGLNDGFGVLLRWEVARGVGARETFAGLSAPPHAEAYHPTTPFPRQPSYRTLYPL
jgi:hypothetical protein